MCMYKPNKLFSPKLAFWSWYLIAAIETLTKTLVKSEKEKKVFPENFQGKEGGRTSNKKSDIEGVFSVKKG